ncbi:MAG: 5'/3'-nucleotidase SurE [Planctomycetota bacterium]|jgi:5'-nucleotidase|nr:5'/3'-nucleotidase SurE [Planctomycetota bacterium]
MTILLTNDDGVDAPGLAILARFLAGLDDLVVAAPAENQSGVGMAITITRGLMAERRPDGPGGVPRHSIDGTPADAVKYALGHLFREKPPRLVVSGINYGPNLGRNVRCSGTVGAAFEALTSGLPALAVSVEYAVPPNWDGAGHYARRLAEKALKLAESRPDRPFLLNLNVPSRPPGEIAGLVAARHGTGGFLETLVRKPDGEGFVTGGEWLVSRDGDAAVFDAGFAVVTPLRFEMTDEALLDDLRWRWREDLVRPGTDAGAKKGNG